MSGLLRREFESASDIGGQVLHQPAPRAQPLGNHSTKPVRPVTRINGQRILFADLAEMAWPQKTEAHLAFILRCDARTARRYLSRTDPTEPPAAGLAAVLAEIMRRAHQRD